MRRLIGGMLLLFSVAMLIIGAMTHRKPAYWYPHVANRYGFHFSSWRGRVFLGFWRLDRTPASTTQSSFSILPDDIDVHDLYLSGRGFSVATATFPNVRHFVWAKTVERGSVNDSACAQCRVSGTGCAFGTARTYMLGLPLWMMLLSLGWLPILLVRNRLRSWRRRRRGLCLNCGYNLQGNTSGRCPECGTAVDRGLERANHWPRFRKAS